jgi:hypothetical protein
MEFISSCTVHHVPTAKLLAPANGGPAGAGAWSPGPGLLQRANAPIETPDRSYWTAYDHFMIEREAREMRRAHMQALFTKWWAAVRKRLRG